MLTTDERMMARCLQLAVKGREGSRPNPMVGAVIVDNVSGRIIGEGWHRQCGKAHAEVNAFASVAESDEELLRQSTVYVSLEPCAHYGKTPPCADLIVRKGVSRVVVGCVDPFAKVQGRGINRIREAGISVTTGVLEARCRWLNRRFFTYHEHHRPYIILKWAQTADGFIDLDGHPLAISTPLTRVLVHQLRAEEDAILVGRVTEEREHPLLNVRHWHGRSPRRFVLSHATSIGQVLDECYEQQLQSLVVEGGRATLQSFIDLGLWDELRIETATKLISGRGTRAPQRSEAVRLFDRQQFGDNIVCRYIPA
ncbi:MAG: bifunctional diaminohydroxyphosphoribosylaminopyrimidine deaminase/5-amino-6-(5-phosphoribosylamino)uracil reductase RibD [Prevotella sp.]|nr:bifunctional diaminohydroxyphosphoribosylaminopyrimidine deaminase/5-amino-6-(5-phosphoribosylamino)uracil reductase RibD [Prevotella sp.]